MRTSPTPTLAAPYLITPSCRTAAYGPSSANAVREFGEGNAKGHVLFQVRFGSDFGAKFLRVFQNRDGSLPGRSSIHHEKAQKPLSGPSADKRGVLSGLV